MTKRPSVEVSYYFSLLAVVLLFYPNALCAIENKAQSDEQAVNATVKVLGTQPGKDISPELFGIFFEDINYAADGGLYAELIENRSFEYSKEDNQNWNSLTSWQLVKYGSGKGQLTVETASPLNANNPHYAELTVEEGGEGVGLMNTGFDGIPVKAGEKYKLSFFARQTANEPAAIFVRLESKSGGTLGEAYFTKLTDKWAKYTAEIQAKSSAEDARLVFSTRRVGKIDFDVVSLFPQKTFKNRENGLRADLAQVIADLKPKFVRFPGGCLAHGLGLENIYRWKDTIGPVEQRKEQKNIWRYHQSVGLGYFEYFQFCEDIGATALPVLAAGVCCQNSPGGQHCIPMADMPAYIQDILDLVEYANGSETSAWGAKRAAAGHSKPFNLKYLGIGNEDAQTDGFRERFEMIQKAINAKYPAITVIGTVGPFHSGKDFDEGWQFADKQKISMVDEHYYCGPEWFLENLKRYDSYDRSRSKVYLGEYASWGNSLYNALAEAAYMTALERNGDVVKLSSYAPLLGRDRHTQWNPNLIYFNSSTVVPTVNYYVQQLFSLNTGETYYPTEVSFKALEIAQKKCGIILGTWNTQSEYKDVKVTDGKNTLFEEKFIEPAKRWIVQSGRWEIIDGAYRQTSVDQPALSYIAPVIDSEKYVYTVKARKISGDEGFLIGFASTDKDNDYWWNVGGWGNTSHAIQKNQGGGNRATVGRNVPGKIETGRWYTIRIERDGNRYKCFLDDKLIHEFSHTMQTAFAASTVKDKASGDVIVKIVNVSPAVATTQVQLDLPRFDPNATKIVLTGDPKSTNRFSTPLQTIPKTSSIKVDKSFVYNAPPYSLTIIRVKEKTK